MSTLMKQLDDMTNVLPPSGEYWEAAEKCQPYWDALEKAFAKKFVRDMYDAQMELCGLECDEHFARGCRLGASLIMELLTPGASGSPGTRHRSSSDPQSGRPR